MKKDYQKDPIKPKKKKPSGAKNRKGSGFWIGLICFSSVWMFVLGILVGRGTMPVQFDIQKLQKELVALKEIMIQKEKDRLKAYSDAAHNKSGLEFYEVLKQTGDNASGNKSLNISPQESLKLAVPTVTKQPILKKRSLSKATKQKRAVKKIRPGETEKQWTIQVSSLKDPAAADRMITTLKQKGYPAYRVTANVSGKGVWFRVRIGPYKDKTEAEKKITLLKKDKYNAILISL